MDCINYKSGQCGSNGHYCPYKHTDREKCMAYQEVLEVPFIQDNILTDEENKAIGKHMAREIVQKVFHNKT